MRSKESALIEYVPVDQREDTRIKLIDELAPVVTRLAGILPSEKIWELFHSMPDETGGRISFPYCRVDNTVISVSDEIVMANRFNLTPKELEECYQKASKDAFCALTWVEIGFQGLQNLATNKASVNWTSDVGHSVSDEERARGIMASGKKMYENCLRDYVQFRTKRGLRDDDFSKYNLEHLLQTIP